MTEFNKAIKHIKTCLFWDFADGQWLDTLSTPLDRDYFNRLMQGVVEAHEAENAKLRKLVCHMYECMSNVDADGNRECFSCKYEGAECEFDRRMAQLGVEVD